MLKAIAILVCFTVAVIASFLIGQEHGERREHDRTMDIVEQSTPPSLEGKLEIMKYNLRTRYYENLK